ncbi:DUF3347 domain-containing protein [Antarcticibacterium flavum]|uniref:DUF3347 domain-containing protein n=1 Tax=Antarcticibacterium flavum TaxID=2058175 RepID=A0A5B7X4G5_9FLAO|nr:MULTISPECIES: DUF3347 domain-containing protein [Antarcticibacterium]MCM4158463.1 hypothetical protein [Antarcticibacterium sp. W02-3]QCY70219.1 DUF3347 domain-containing protein [Antarcticibacterium flavum]
MKTLKTTIVFLLLTAFMGCKENQSVEVNTPEEVEQEAKETADIADQEFIDGMTGAIWHHYLTMKMALTASDADQVQQSAGDIAEILTEERVQMKGIAQSISETDDIEAQRKLFAQFTEEIGPMFEEALSGGTIYKQFCPMAFDNKGAYWYSSVKEISNPYFGEKMPNCGSVEKTISK